MKKLILILVIGFCSLSAFGQYVFNLDIRSQTLEGKKISLEIYNNRNYIPVKIDSFIFKNSPTTLSGQVNQTSNFAAFLVKLDNGKFIRTLLVIDSGKNHINVEMPDAGSKMLKLTSDARGNQIFGETNKVASDIIDHYPNSRKANGLLNMTHELFEKINQAQYNRLELYPNDFGSLICLYHISRTSIDPDDARQVLATLATFSDSIRNTPVGKQLYDEEIDLINNKLAAKAGGKALIFNVKDIDGKPFSNSSLLGQNYIIAFSATWCGPCQQELPKLKKLYETYKARGLKVVYFNNDDNVKRWKEHVAKNKLEWINVSERLKPSLSKIQKSFGVYAIPTCLVVNKEGLIVYNSDATDIGLNYLETYIKKVISD